jgi:hypothetical protein
MFIGQSMAFPCHTSWLPAALQRLDESIRVEWLLPIVDTAAASAARRVSSSSYAVMNTIGSGDFAVGKRRRNSIPDIPPRWMSRTSPIA